MAVSKRLRFEILRRDNHACRYCGRMAPDVQLTVDHVVPVTLGGSDDPQNLVAACRDCNGGKSSISPDAEVVADVAEDAMRWRKAMEVANEMAERERGTKEAFATEFHEHWMEFTYKIPSYHSKTGKDEERHIDLPIDWQVKVGDLMAAGLTVPDMCEAIDVAMAARNVKDEFFYFIGVARNTIARRQSVAQELIRRGLA